MRRQLRRLRRRLGTAFGHPEQLLPVHRRRRGSGIVDRPEGTMTPAELIGLSDDTMTIAKAKALARQMSKAELRAVLKRLPGALLQVLASKVLSFRCAIGLHAWTN